MNGPGSRRGSSSRWPTVGLVGLLGAVLPGCADDEPTGGDTSSSTSFTPLTGGGPTTTGRPSTTSTTALTSSTSSTGNGVTTSSTSTSMSSASASAPGCADPRTTGAAETGDMGFVFSDTDYCDYVQVDRIGVPLVTTLLVVDSQDDYNATAAGRNPFGFFNEINTSIGELHDALDGALQDQGFTPCELTTCSNQVVTGLLVPDALTFDPDGADGFTNGRRLDEPILDLMLALVLLDLGVHEIDAFVQLPLGPLQNDVAFSDAWPYVAAPHP